MLFDDGRVRKSEDIGRGSRHARGVSFEIPFLLFVNGLRSPVLDPLIGFISEWALYGYLLVFVGVALRVRDPKTTRAMLDGWLAFLIAIFVSETIVKPLIHRLRPTGVETLRAQLHVLGTVPSASSTGMPSGTATACAAGAMWITLCFGKKWGALAWSAAVFISLTRLYVGIHYPTDLIVGLALGALIAWLVHRGVDRFART